MITLNELKQDKEISAIIQTSAKQIDALEFTEHSVRHASIVASWTSDILEKIGESKKLVNLGEIAGYLHDIGNALSRHNHAQSGALLAYNLLVARGLSFVDAAEIMMAIGNHDEKHGVPVSVLSSALIIADKSDVHRSRVRHKNTVVTPMNIHDRVNYAATKSYINVDTDKKTIDTIVQIDTEICSLGDYFEIYHTRMLMCEQAAKLLGYKYGLILNGVQML